MQGLKEFEIEEQLKIAKVANRDDVLLGLFNPIDPNQDVIDFAMSGTKRKAAQPVPIGDLGLSQIDLTGQSLKGQFQDPRNQPVAPPVRRAADVLREEEINKILTGRP